MGYGWRRVMETMRQKVGTDKAFVATSNARNEAMFKEATDFCNHLRLLERDLRSMHKEIDGAQDFTCSLEALRVERPAVKVGRDDFR